MKNTAAQLQSGVTCYNTVSHDTGKSAASEPQPDRPIYLDLSTRNGWKAEL